MKKVLILKAFALTLGFSEAQTLYPLGEDEYFEEEQSGYTTKFVPERFPDLPHEVDLSFLLPQAGEQGKKGSCWAWATAYAIRSTLDNPSSTPNYFINQGQTNFEKVYSPEYVYQVYKGDKNDCEYGNLSKNVLKKILKDGAVKFSQFPYDEKSCNIKVSRALIESAKRYAMPEYEVDILNDIYSMKKVLAIDKQPLVISIKVDNFFSTKGNITFSNPFWTTFHTKVGSHAMVVVGYNDEYKSFKVLNSWGIEFGDKGYVWISYDLVDTRMNYSCYLLKKRFDTLPLTNNSIAEKGLAAVNIDMQEISTWFKEGYYRSFDSLKVVLSDLNQSEKFAVVEIRDSSYELITNFYVDYKSSKEFYIEKQKFEFTLDNIAKAGRNPFRKAAYFTLRKL